MKILLLFLSFSLLVFSQHCNLPGELRDDCGYKGITQGECEGKGCCWSPLSNSELEDADFPWCFYQSQSDCGNYVVSEVLQTPTGILATLVLSNPGCEYYGADISPLSFQVDMETDDRLHVKIFDPQNSRYEVPESVIPRPTITSSAEKTANYRFGYTANPFGFHISRVNTGEVIFNTSTSLFNPQFKGLVFEDQYLEISTQLPSDSNIFGLGERIRKMKLETGLTYTLWNADEPTPENQNLYGHHPFYLEHRNGKSHGVFLLNSNGMDIVYGPDHLTYKAIGGVLDFYYFLGPTPAKVIEQYTELIGRPYMMPYWSLGFHQCKYGYKNLDEVKGVVQGYADAQIPLETMWIDIDYMDEFQDWTFDPVHYPPSDVREFVEGLHQKNQRNVLIVDPGIKNRTGYKYYDEGLIQDIFIKDKNDEVFIGMVWPYYTAFPDFLHPGAQAYWTDSIKDFREIVPVDGLWVDMNEIASFCYGDELSTCQYPIPFDPKDDTIQSQSQPQPRPKKDKKVFDPTNPPYAINNANDHSPLQRKTTSMDAKHYGGFLEYDVHQLYGILETMATTKGLEELTNKRAFVLSRSTFPGSGKYGGHWTGDNYSTWAHLYYSIGSMLNFQMFGIPYAGADICGFIKDTTEELCARWMQVGAFYPFSRNHNTLGAAPQEPYLWETVAEVSRVSLGIRYSLLPLYYTLTYQAHEFGATIVRPLFYEFPEDENVIDNDRQFLIGDAILVSPVLDEGQITVTAYFPEARWYNFYSFEQFSSTGETQVLDAPIDVIPLHFRGGAIVPFQYTALTTTEVKENNYYLIVALDESGSAQGNLYVDDGESLDLSNHTYISYSALSNENTGKVTSSGTYQYTITPVLDKITILGVKSSPSTVLVNGQQVTFEHKDEHLIVSPLQVSMNKDFVLEWK